MEKFIDTLLRLPNLRRLELLSVSHRSPVAAALKRKSTIFPNIREMAFGAMCPNFIKSCPNLESLTFRCVLDHSACRAIKMHGAGLKRITGVDPSTYASRWGKLTAHPSTGPSNLEQPTPSKP